MLGLIVSAGLASCGSAKATGSADAAPIDGAAGAPVPIALGGYGPCDSMVVESSATAAGPGGTITLTDDGPAVAGAPTPGLRVTADSHLLALANVSIAFQPPSGGTAIAVPGQTYPVSDLPCATASVEHGALAVTGDTLLVSLVGQGCGAGMTGMLRCTVPAQPVGSVDAPAGCASAGACASGKPAFPSGTFAACAGSQPSFQDQVVTLSEGPAGLVATIDAAPSRPMAVTRTALAVTADSDHAATIVAGQTWDLMLPGVTAAFVAVTVTITDASLVADGETLFVFVSGTSAGGAIHEMFACARS